jgi:ABC-type microcin C transport system permease subunit YejB
LLCQVTLIGAIKNEIPLFIISLPQGVSKSDGNFAVNWRTHSRSLLGKFIIKMYVMTLVTSEEDRDSLFMKFFKLKALKSETFDEFIPYKHIFTYLT